MARKPLRELDLNLLPVLRSLLVTHSVARTAKTLALTPSAVSHALARLRTALRDELFVRTPAGLAPTRRASELAADLDAGLATIERALDGTAFDARATSRTFRIATSDFGARLIVPKLLALLDDEAPRMQLQIRPLPVDTEDALADDIDLMIGIYAGSSASIFRRALFTETTAVLARRGHPRIKRGTIALDDYLACRHVVIAPRGRPGGPIDRHLAERGQSRQVALLVPNFLLAPYVVAETDFLLSAGERLLQSCIGMLAVQVVALPFPLPAFDVQLVWHARVHGDPACAWLRDKLVAVHDEIYKR